jgi:hypothetical protein
MTTYDPSFQNVSLWAHHDNNQELDSTFRTVECRGDLSVDGIIDLNDANINGDVGIGGTLDVILNTTLRSDVSIGGNLSVTGSSALPVINTTTVNNTISTAQNFSALTAAQVTATTTPVVLGGFATTTVGTRASPHFSFVGLADIATAGFYHFDANLNWSMTGDGNLLVSSLVVTRASDVIVAQCIDTSPASGAAKISQHLSADLQLLPLDHVQITFSTSSGTNTYKIEAGSSFNGHYICP